jgi:hypothetical protein
VKGTPESERTRSVESRNIAIVERYKPLEPLAELERLPHTLSKATKSNNATSIIAIFIGQNPISEQRQRLCSPAARFSRGSDIHSRMIALRALFSSLIIRSLFA